MKPMFYERKNRSVTKAIWFAGEVASNKKKYLYHRQHWYGVYMKLKNDDTFRKMSKWARPKH
jgi:hypothetical protein